MYFNKNNDHAGPVFQNRFKSILIESNAYFMRLSQYIYLNPVRAGLVKDPSLYKFSSLREAVGKEPLYFLDEDIVRLVGETKGSQKEFEKFIYEGISDDFSEIESIFEKDDPTLGTNKFYTLTQKKYLRRKNKNYVKFGR